MGLLPKRPVAYDEARQPIIPPRHIDGTLFITDVAFLKYDFV